MENNKSYISRHSSMTVKLGNNGEEMLQEACGLEVMSRLNFQIVKAF
jgi:hypothetical protein